MKNLNHKQHWRTTPCFLIRLLGPLLFAALIISHSTHLQAIGYTLPVIYYDNKNDTFWKNYAIAFTKTKIRAANQSSDNEYLPQEETIQQLFISAHSNHAKEFPDTPIPRSEILNDLPSKARIVHKNIKEVSYIVVQKNPQMKDTYILHLYIQNEKPETGSIQEWTLLASINASQDVYDALTDEDSYRDQKSINHPTPIEEDFETKPLPEQQTTDGVVPPSHLPGENEQSSNTPPQQPLPQAPEIDMSSNPVYGKHPPQGHYPKISITSETSPQKTLNAYQDITFESSQYHSVPQPFQKPSPPFSPHLTGVNTLVETAKDLHISKELPRLSPSNNNSIDTGSEQGGQIALQRDNMTYGYVDPHHQPLCSSQFLSTVSFWLLSQPVQQLPRWVIQLIGALFNKITQKLQLKHIFTYLPDNIARLVSPSLNDPLVSHAVEFFFHTFGAHAEDLMEWLDIYRELGIDLMNPQNYNHQTDITSLQACKTIQAANAILSYYNDNQDSNIWEQQGHIPNKYFWSPSVLERHKARSQALEIMCKQLSGSDLLPQLITINKTEVNTVGAIQKLAVNIYNYLPYFFLHAYINYFMHKALEIPPQLTSEPTQTVEDSPQHIASKAIEMVHSMGAEELPRPLLDFMFEMQPLPLPKNPQLIISSELQKTHTILTAWKMIPSEEKLKKHNLMLLGTHLEKVRVSTEHFHCSVTPKTSCLKSTPELLGLIAGGEFTMHNNNNQRDVYKPTKDWFKGEKTERSQWAIQALDTLQQHYIPHAYTVLLYKAQRTNK